MKFVPEPTREVCLRCLRPKSVCYCAALTEIETVTRVVILQHPRENGMPIGTARMASLCLPKAKLIVGFHWDESEALRDAVSDPERPPILLYPGEGARDILSDPPKGPVTLIVIDGTWSQAKSVVRDNPALARLPRYAFETPEPTCYRIRREPRAEYVSTIEALMHVLGVLEGDPAKFRALQAPMRTMIDNHLARQSVAPNVHAHHARPPLPRGRRKAPMAAEVVRRASDLVVVVGESNAWPSSAPERALGDELIHWVACRVATGQTFEMVVAPRKSLAPGTPKYSRISEAELRAGATATDMRDQFANWLRPSDLLCAWGFYGTSLFDEISGKLPGTRMDLRGAARQLTNRSVGTLEQYAESVVDGDAPVSQAVVPQSDAPRGRAGERLQLLVKIVNAWVREHADSVSERVC